MGESRQLSAEEASGLQAFQSRCVAAIAAEKAQPRGAVIRVEEGDYVLYSWAEQTTSLGVEIWIKERSMIPIQPADLGTLKARGYPHGGEALVALGWVEGDVNGRVHVLHRREGDIRIDTAERVTGSEDDQWYPGSDWNPGVIFPAKRS